MSAPISPDTVVAERYKLLDCLGAGAMGEVWRAQDNKFSRPVFVAVKFLKEDETFAADARNRGNLARLFDKEAVAGHLTFDLVVNLLAESFNADHARAALLAAAEARFAGRPVTPAEAVALFDELVDDSSFNENARQRKRLRDLFAAEANSVAVLQHPHLVRVTDYGEHDSVPFLVMDFINGRTLQQVIQRREALPVATRLRLMEDLCEGLGYAHSKDLVHRDIKPANLIIDGESGRLKILDFGVVRQLQASAQRTVSMGLPIGTYCYMSPEQTRASRSLDHRSDVFAVGLVFYELLSYQRAFPSAGDVGELVGRIQRDPPRPLRDLVPDLDPEIEAIVYTAIEKVAAKRYQDLADMRDDIERIRRRLEGHQRRLVQLASPETTIRRPKSLQQQVTDLLDRATAAFDIGDDRAVIDLCDEILGLSPDHSDALLLKDHGESRLTTRRLESLLADARRQLASGDLNAAGQVLEHVEIDPRHPMVRAFIADLESARRVDRVNSLVQSARMNLAVGASDAAVERAEAALGLDPGNTDAQRILELARTQRKQQRQREVDAALAEAERAVVEGRLNDAIRGLSALAGEPAVDAMLTTLLPRRDEQLAREEKIADLTGRAQALGDSGEFSRALELVQQAASLDRKNADVVALRRRLEPIAHALQQVDEAVALFDQDEAHDAQERLQGALDVLIPHVEAFPPLRARIAAVDVARHAAIERQRAEEKRQAAAAQERRRRALEAEQEQQQRLVVERVRAALAQEWIEGAERDLAELVQLPGSSAVAAELTTSLAAIRTQSADRAAARQCDAARHLVETGDLDGAMALLRAVSPAHPLVEAEIVTIEQLIRRRDDERERAAEVERSRRELERRVDDAITAADARFAAGNRTDALALLATFLPRDSRIEEHHTRLVREHARLEAAERAEMERGRLEAERERREAERQELLRGASKAREQREYGTALALLDELVRLDAGREETRNLRADVLAELRAVAESDPTNADVQDVLRRFDNPRPRRSPYLRLAVAAAVLIALSTVMWRFRPVAPPPPAPSPTDVSPEPAKAGPPSVATPVDTNVSPSAVSSASGPATLIVDLRPWARVRLVPTDGKSAVAPEPQITPFVVTLPAGEYSLRGENDGISSPVQLTIRLEAGRTRVVSQNMPGFDPDRMVDTLLRSERERE